MPLKNTRFVVSSGNPFARSKRICWPNSEIVPVPVRSFLRLPSMRILRSESSYGIGMSVSGRGGIWVRIACSCS